MSLSAIIDVTIGMMLMYLLLSLICTAVTEFIASLFKLRARTLKRGMKNLLTDEKTAKAFLRHPAIRALTSNTGISLLGTSDDCSSSYIPAPLFARVLMTVLDPSLLQPNAETSSPIDVFRGKVDNAAASVPANQTEATDANLTGGPAALNQAIAGIIWDATDICTAQKRIEEWFDAAMDRVSGWYKRRVQIISFVAGLAIAVAMNADSLRVA